MEEKEYHGIFECRVNGTNTEKMEKAKEHEKEKHLLYILPGLWLSVPYEKFTPEYAAAYRAKYLAEHPNLCK